MNDSSINRKRNFNWTTYGNQNDSKYIAHRGLYLHTNLYNNNYINTFNAIVKYNFKKPYRELNRKRILHDTFS